ncbi:MAG: hypothetical protein Q9191_007769 [Dirinaria sp. TL-2023a]
MSLNAGGLAQMTYNSHNSFSNGLGNGLGVPGTGFASRGKGSHIKRLSVAPPTNISTIDETQQVNPTPTPRTSRSHLLAGLRTAPKSPAVPPNSAPPTQLQDPGSGYNVFAKDNNHYGRGMPQTSIGTQFPKNQPGMYGMNANGQMYHLPEQILAPPALHVEEQMEGSGMDPDVYAELVATNQYLAQQQMRLQQQLMDVTAAAQQFQGMKLNDGVNQQQYAQSPITPGGGYYGQPIVQAVPNQPGMYSVFNPMTGQHVFVMDNASQQPQQQEQQATFSNQDLSQSPPPLTPTFHAQVSPPPEASVPWNTNRKQSPPRLTSSPPRDVDPLPPPSANAFRPGHKKAASFAPGAGSENQSPAGLPKTLPKSAGFPQTPMTGTFGPGQARAGEHPIRQPRGPPSLEELVAKPTAKFEGSKNFVTRQRRRAVNNLVRAGIERRGASRGSGSIDSLGTPASESELNFSLPSDNESDGVGSRSGSSLSSKHGAIGSERKEMKDRSQERGSTDSFSAGSASSEDGSSEGKVVEVKAGNTNSGRKTPLLVLTSAEKRKSSLF